MAEKKEKVNKNIPSVLPSGFIIRVNERNITMLDFIDIDYEDKATVIGSYALDEKMIKNLSESIQNALKAISE